MPRTHRFEYHTDLEWFHEVEVENWYERDSDNASRRSLFDYGYGPWQSFVEGYGPWHELLDEAGFAGDESRDELAEVAQDMMNDDDHWLRLNLRRKTKRFPGFAGYSPRKQDTSDWDFVQALPRRVLSALADKPPQLTLDYCAFLRVAHGVANVDDIEPEFTRPAEDAADESQIPSQSLLLYSYWSNQHRPDAIGLLTATLAFIPSKETARPVPIQAQTHMFDHGRVSTAAARKKTALAVCGMGPNGTSLKALFKEDVDATPDAPAVDALEEDVDALPDVQPPARGVRATTALRVATVLGAHQHPSIELCRGEIERYIRRVFAPALARFVLYKFAENVIRDMPRGRLRRLRRRRGYDLKPVAATPRLRCHARTIWVPHRFGILGRACHGSDLVRSRRLGRLQLQARAL